MIVVAEVVPPARIVCRLVGGAHSVLYRMPIQALAASVVGHLKAPLIHNQRIPFDVDAVQSKMALPAHVSCISAPAIVAGEDVAKDDGRKEKQDSEERWHGGRGLKNS